MMIAIKPTLKEAVINQFSPESLGKRGLKVLVQYLELFADLPKEIRRGIYTVKTGNLKFQIDLNQLVNMQRSLTRASNRLAVSAITSALIVGTSIIISFGEGPVIAGINLFDAFGIGAIIGGALVLFSIWREKS